MNHLLPSAKQLIVGVVAAGALSVDVAGVAGAVSPSPGPSPTPARLAHVDCANAAKALHAIEKAETQIAAGLPELTQRQSQLAANGHSRLADRVQKAIDRLESPQARSRLDNAASAIEAKCNVPAPTNAA